MDEKELYYLVRDTYPDQDRVEYNFKESKIICTIEKGKPGRWITLSDSEAKGFYRIWLDCKRRLHNLLNPL
jgi:hypothetical protein